MSKINYRSCCQCDTIFPVPKNNWNKKFCTQSCGSINQHKNQRQKRIDRYNLSPKQCIGCDSILKFENRKNNFCSISCSSTGNQNRKTHGEYSIKKCQQCGTITKNKKFCSKKCAGLHKMKYKTEEERIHARKMKQREAYARYAAKKKHQTPVGADLEAVKLFYANCPIGYEVDHIIPISKGGPHSIENLQYLTISENRKKSNKLNWCPEDESNVRPTL